MRIAEDILQAVRDNGRLSTRTESYLGQMTHRCAAVNFRWVRPWNWKKVENEAVPASLGPIFLPPDFDDLLRALSERPLAKAGLLPDPARNLEFLQGEVLRWLGYDPCGRTRYPEMWDGIQNVEDYPREARRRVPQLVSKLDSLLSLRPDSASRSFELRFPADYCPITWAFIIAPGGNSLEASLIFRSVEVSRNILNDLYLFCVYFGYIFAQTGQSIFDIPISAVGIFALDAHLIEFEES